MGRFSRNPLTQRYVKKFAKTRFLILADPTLKTFYEDLLGLLVQIQCKRTPRLRQACQKVVHDPFGMSQVATYSQE